MQDETTTEILPIQLGVVPLPKAAGDKPEFDTGPFPPRSMREAGTLSGLLGMNPDMAGDLWMSIQQLCAPPLRSQRWEQEWNTQTITNMVAECLAEIVSGSDAQLLEQQLAETELPPALEDWFARFVGGTDVSIEIDSSIYCEGMNGIYDCIH